MIFICLLLIKFDETVAFIPRNHFMMSCYVDNEDPSIRVGLRFMSPTIGSPPFLFMQIQISYYTFDYSSLTFSETLWYNMIPVECQGSEYFPISYGRTFNHRIEIHISLGLRSDHIFSRYRLTMSGNVFSELHVLTDYEGVAYMYVHFVSGLSEIVRRSIEPKKPYPMVIFDNEKLEEALYTCVFMTRRFNIRIVHGDQTPRFKLPLITVNLTVYKSENQQKIILYDLLFMCWQIAYNPSIEFSKDEALVILFDNEWDNIFMKFTATDFSNIQTNAIYYIKDGAQHYLDDKDYFHFKEIRIQKVKKEIGERPDHAKRFVVRHNYLNVFYRNRTWYECQVRNKKSQLFIDTYSDVHVNHIFYSHTHYGPQGVLVVDERQISDFVFCISTATNTFIYPLQKY
ncbi:hypothetical protein RF11_08671 [Thelohanellus kitauei]|uniref:Uncharacterized protein n=1 Tax=Thelohanellus kitauei TaxID=669202 RepID=A0A0C2NE16_THEKT|nr:hypothetical protein RF11_08671 [Thelohanellus kitauei]